MKKKSTSEKKENIQSEDPHVTSFFQQKDLSEELVDKIFSLMLARQDTINQQLENAEKRYTRQIEEQNRLMEASTQNALQRMEMKNQQLEEIGFKISNQLINNYKYRPDEEQQESSEKGKKTRKKNQSAFGENNAVIEMFRKKGYTIHGAIVGNNFSDEEKKEIMQAGLFLIEQYGKSFVLNAPEEFVPRGL